jgi:ribosomal protein S18 acetylase RimI-like enzyme
VNTIRDATLEDAALIASLNGDVQAIHAVGLPHHFKPPVLDQSLIDEFRSMIAKKDCFFLIAEADGVAAGYVFAELMSRQESARVHPDQMLYIHHISVNAEFRRKGLGRSLLEEARKRALSRGITRMALDVWRFNEEARQFFAGYGLETYNEKMWMQIG